MEGRLSETRTTKVLNEKGLEVDHVWISACYVTMLDFEERPLRYRLLFDLQLHGVIPVRLYS